MILRLGLSKLLHIRITLTSSGPLGYSENSSAYAHLPSPELCNYHRCLYYVYFMLLYHKIVYYIIYIYGDNIYV